MVSYSFLISFPVIWRGKNYHITFTVTLNHKTKQIETSIELIGTILTRIVTYTKFFTRYTKVFFNQSESALQTELNYLMLHVCLFQLYWMRMSEPNPITVGTYVYSPDTRFSVTKDHTSTHWDLRIRNVKLEDAGVYFCAVSSGEGREKHRRLIKLNVKGRYRVKPVGRKTCFPIN